MASEVEEYLDRFDAAQRLAEHIVSVADQILEVSEFLRRDPLEALSAMPSEWPTAEQLRALMREAARMEAELPKYWAKVPKKYRDSLPRKHPDRAGSVGFLDDEDLR